MSAISREYHLPKFDGIHNLTLSEAPMPKPKANEVLVKIHAVSLNYRDLIIAKGTYPMPAKTNVIPTSDAAGEIVELGSDLAAAGKWATGDRVCANFALDHVHGDTTEAIKKTALGAPVDGVLAEYRTFPVHSLVKIPDQLSYEEASTLPCAAVTAYNALLGPVPLKGGDTVLVQGTGGVSIFALQFAAASGATVIATSSSDEKLKIAKSLGAHHLINYKKTPDWDKEVLKITNGRGVDHIIEVGGPGTIEKTIGSVRIGGFIHAIGFVAEGKSDINIPLYAIMKAFSLRGISIGSVAQFEDMNRLIAANNIRPVVDKVFAFEDALKAYEYLESQAHVGKVVIKVSKN
ncbi:hypothetical protein PLICRDRAFT_46689 [Plicaturopsis crispa FD-325 SS-3]|uniref:Enoyl reductase (ER) domain-containing protein n=1 Tax=Plicaturopsis crispa FD-325 SS-3 TaxID=944288 RepID=A0A0C9SKL0_PLICR|nr:hypothetical protein PLICRDRAFT_46689 [Plicaturopsis crispa FD-325 SS-3]